jgi:hypothetical protein
MATGRKKTKKKKGGGRRRMGSAGNRTQLENTVYMATGALVGALGQRFGIKLAQEQKVITDPKKVELMNDLITVGGLLAGAAAVVWAPHPFLKGLGIGVGVQAALDGAKRLGVPIAGVGLVDRRTLQFPDRRELNGLDDMRKTNIGNAPRATHQLGLARTSIGALTRAKRTLFSS